MIWVKRECVYAMQHNDFSLRTIYNVYKQKKVQKHSHVIIIYKPCYLSFMCDTKTELKGKRVQAKNSRSL